MYIYICITRRLGNMRSVHPSSSDPAHPHFGIKVCPIRTDRKQQKFK